MSFHGLFIGVDRYASPYIDELSCARRDAQALHALFTDTLGGTTTLLTDGDATREAIRAGFEELAECSDDDMVVIAFSGHGSETHELVTYDADVFNLAGTCVPLDELREWFSKIPAKHLVFVLDCCFSGGIGAKVLRVETKSRDMQSANAALDRLSGEGRLILTAATATQPAYENSRFGHGFLTYYLIEALLGAEEVRQGDQVSIYRLLDYVTRRVTDAAAQIGEPQHPTLRGVLDGAMMWPVFKAGSLYEAAFPERGTAPVTAEIQSLASYGFPQELIAAWSASIPSLNELQIDAINEFGVLRGDHLVVSAPTSSGKTMVGELASLRGVLDRKRAFFLLPLKALVNDKHRQFNATYGSFGVRTIRATGESSDDIPALLRGHYDICLMTYEKFSALALGMPHILNQVGTVVVDEVQMIADSSRGINLEFILTLLRMRRRMSIEPQLIALSAVIGDTNGLEGWLGARLLLRKSRPIPLDEGVLRQDGSFRFVSSDTGDESLSPFIRKITRNGGSQEYIIPLVRELVRQGKQVIVFRETRAVSRGCAIYLAESLGLPPAQSALNRLPEGDPSVSSRALRQALAGGVAFHISDLDREERQVIEEEFRRPGTDLKVIVATTTLAMGVNTPAEAVVVAGLKHPGDVPYSVAEYKNIIGRAGRLGFATRGESYLLATSQLEESHSWTEYVRGFPEDLRSQFLNQDTDPRSLIVKVLSTARRLEGDGMAADDIVEFLESSFGAYQMAHSQESWSWDRSQLMQALTDLATHNLVAENDQGRYILTELGRVAGDGGVEVKSILRLVAAFTLIQPDALSDPTLIAATQITAELDQVLFPMNKSSTIKEPQTWMGELQRQGVAIQVQQSIQKDINETTLPTLRAKKAVACLLWMTDLPMAKVEQTLTQFGKPDGAAGAIRSVAARSYDLLPTVGRVAELLHPGFDLSVRLPRLMTRLEVGVPASQGELAYYIGIRFGRGDYLDLLKGGFSSMASLDAAADETLLSLLGGSQEKLKIIRTAVKKYDQDKERKENVIADLPIYEA